MSERLTARVMWRAQHAANVAADPRWQWLKAHWPPGVPPEEPLVRCSLCGVAVEAHDEDLLHLECPLPGTETDQPWPATFGEYDADGRPVHRPGHDGDYCFQCLGCRWWLGGGDWGECQAKTGPYYRHQVWEHYTCREFQARKR